MAAEDDSGCLNLIDPNDGEFSNSSGSFSGFSPLREEELQAAKKAKKGKQKAASKTSQKASKKSKNSGNLSASAPINERNTNSEKSPLSELIEKLTPQDIEQFRDLLGVNPQPYEYAYDEDMEAVFGCNLNNYPGLTVELTEDSDSELVPAPIKNRPKKEAVKACGYCQ